MSGESIDDIMDELDELQKEMDGATEEANLEESADAELGEVPDAGTTSDVDPDAAEIKAEPEAVPEPEPEPEPAADPEPEPEPEPEPTPKPNLRVIEGQGGKVPESESVSDPTEDELDQLDKELKELEDDVSESGDSETPAEPPEPALTTNEHQGASLESTLGDVDPHHPENQKPGPLDGVHSGSGFQHSESDFMTDNGNGGGDSGNLTLQVAGNLQLNLRFASNGQEVAIGFKDGFLCVQLADGTEFKVPVRTGANKKTSAA